MSDRPEQATSETTDEPASAEPTEPASPPEAPRYREVAIALAGALLMIVVLVGTSPFWAPLLPWGAAAADDGATALARAEQLGQRIAALETRPAPQPADLGDLRQQIAKLLGGVADLAVRVERLDKAAAQAQASPELAGRVEALDRTTRTLSAANAELAARIEALDKAGQSRTAHDMTDVGMVLALLQVRNAVQAGRPFAGEYEALAALARGARPEIATAAAALAEPAKTGVAGRPALAKRLRELAGPIIAAEADASAEAAGAEPGWTDAVMSRLRGLVTIRRVDDGPARSGAAAAVNTAELALAGGDLAGSVAALDKLMGPAAAAAAPWLRMARERLAVETALQRVEALLTARLGTGAPPVPGPPG